MIKKDAIFYSRLSSRLFSLAAAFPLLTLFWSIVWHPSFYVTFIQASGHDWYMMAVVASINSVFGIVLSLSFLSKVKDHVSYLKCMNRMVIVWSLTFVPATVVYVLPVIIHYIFVLLT